MFLKSIEIRGFKSFADKTELNFKKGVTAVVGPNGSGKSNISDAVRWVLGEQSVKNLRGGKMEDVIFSGTQFRKPVGLAQVMLTLDNSDGKIPMDYSDITISRRLYRSGESEYYINNTKCRLKDVQEMFMDTGIGKEGYSIIGQGKIEAVLSGKAEDRRGLLEEAAGIVKFKTRKEEAVRRLSNTRENLVRIDDIIGTYEDRLEPLKNESEKANSFLLLSEKLKKNEINLLINSNENMKEKIDDTSKKIENMENDIKDLSHKKGVSNSEVQDIEKELAEMENLYKNEQNIYFSEKTQYQNIISDNKLLKEKIENLTENSMRNNKALAETEQKFSKSKEEKDIISKEIDSLKIRLNDFAKGMDETEKSINFYETKIKNDEDNLKRCKDNQFDIVGTISDSKNFITLIKKDMENHEANIDQLKEECRNFLNSIKINDTTKAALESQITAINGKIKEYSDKIHTNKLEINKLSRVLLEDEKSVKNLSAEQNKIDANKTMITNLEAQYEGYNKSVKNLMVHIRNDKIKYAKDKCFVLGEILNVKKELETAVEIALGGAISNIITEDEKLAKSLINYLKVNNMGRATFLPINILKNRKLNLYSDISEMPGFIGIASELLDYDSKFKPAVDHILGRTVIAGDMNDALAIAKKGNYSFRIVTLKGDVVNAGGALSGGSVFHKSFNIIGRKREIEDLKQKLVTIEAEIKELSEKNNKNRSLIKELDDNNLNLTDEIHSQNIEITKVQGRINAIVSESKKLNDNYNVSKNEINLVNLKFEQSSNDLVSHEKELENLQKSQNEILIKIKDIEKDIEKEKEELQKYSQKSTNIKIEKAKLSETFYANKRDFDRIVYEIQDMTNKLNAIKKEIEDGKSNTIAFNEKIKENSLKLQEIDKHLKNMDENFKENEVRKIEITKKFETEKARLYDSENIIKNKEEQSHKFQLYLTKIETENEAIISKLNTEYNLTLAEALQYKSDISDVSAVKCEIDNFKRSISNLGNVNVGAIEEYKDVKSKYEFMQGQKEDLVKSQSEILNVIDDMTSTMKKVFNKNFEVIRNNFNETFKQLFNGGSADLTIAGDDVLSSDIEINVEPPGKKLQNINLMSGGEKGLSAIALLFAILKMKPSPFCILDEIEAALDDANVVRYAQFLKEFSRGIQFIVITHRKGTMQAGDVLYGVTMEEKGVSKIVSVDLEGEI
ncbi:MAG: chromosome segregation protein SMC [Clostridium sp.]|nr:chromosome segregation protein SMC [Clostridium sp.]